MINILKCTKCGSYGLKSECDCNGKRNIIRPAKFSPEDKYAKYRRLAKETIDDESKVKHESGDLKNER